MADRFGDYQQQHADPTKAYNRKYLQGLIESWTIDKLEFDDRDLLIFVDETGTPDISVKSPVFGLGGCAIKGRDYHEIRKHWYEIRCQLGLSPGEQAHATDYLSRLSVDTRKAMLAFLGNVPILNPFVSTITRNEKIKGSLSPLGSLQKSVSVQLLILMPDTAAVRRAEWIIEHSDSLSRNIVTNALLHYGPTEGGKGIFFMRKQNCEAGLEIADFIVYVAGSWRRSQLDGRNDNIDFKSMLFAHDESYRDIQPIGTVWWGKEQSTKIARVSGPPRSGRL
jgi:hypothetical protein